ncbi:MAG: hypothetical protein JW982_14835 [Spirochaetes bacterium]|nr:hypothetical protein [Spirochaetota bacterium]
MPVIKNLITELPENFTEMICNSVPGIMNISGSMDKISFYSEKIINSDDASFLYKIHDCLQITDSDVAVKGGVNLKIGKAREIFCSPVKIIVYFATMGPEIDPSIQNFFSREMAFEAYLYKSVASLLLKFFTDDCKKIIKDRMKSEYGFKTGCSYSPGYQYWEIEEQKKLTELADPSSIGIELDENCIMHPSISVSGIFGAGTDINEKSVTCSFCSEELCYLKKTDK